MMTPPENRGSVVVLDEHESFAAELGRSFRTLGFSVWLSTTWEETLAICQTKSPTLLVTELRVHGRWAFDFLTSFRLEKPRLAVVIATLCPSIATAVRAIRVGFDGYVAKPVNAQIILAAIEHEAAADHAACEPTAWPTLDRTISEYLNQVFLIAGSMTEAARRLGLDRRSLRRMLAKDTPAR